MSDMCNPNSKHTPIHAISYNLTHTRAHLNQHILRKWQELLATHSRKLLKSLLHNINKGRVQQDLRTQSNFYHCCSKNRERHAWTHARQQTHRYTHTTNNQYNILLCRRQPTAFKWSQIKRLVFFADMFPFSSERLYTWTDSMGSASERERNGNRIYNLYF